MNRFRSLLSPLALILLALPAWSHETEEHKLTASDGVAGDFLGRSVSIRGLDLIAGASGHDALGPKSGAAYIWTHDGTDFVEVAKLLASDGAAGDLFGISVAMGEEYAVVGASWADTGALNSGAVYVFGRNGSVWTEEAKLVPEVPMTQGLFGASVAIHENLILVGSPGAATAHFFRYTPNYLWAQEWVMTSSDATPDNRFGVSVALDTDFALVGAGQQDGVGAAYAYRRVAGMWQEEQKLMSGDPDIDDTFGASVAISAGNSLLIGAPNDDAFGTDSGASYRFKFSGGSWDQVAKRTGINPGDRMGSSVAIAHNFESTGSRYFDFQGTKNSGSTLLWLSDKTGSQELFVSSDPSPGDLLGNSVSMDDCFVAAGSVGDDQLGVDAGAVYVFSIPAGNALPMNGSGANLMGMTTTVGPNIGAAWEVQFNTGVAPGADMTMLVVCSKFLSTPVPIASGELLADLKSRRFLQSLEFGSGVVKHEFLLPNDPSLLGLQAASQGFLQSSTTGKVTALNGELLMIGCEQGHQR